MADTNNIHASELNNALAGANLTEQHQNGFLQAHACIKAAGNTVLASSDGVTADLTDNVAVIADVVSASGSVAHTWVVYQMTAGYFLTLESNDGDATPREVDFFGADAAGYTLTGLLITDRPVPVTAANEWNRVNIDLIPTAVPATNMTVHYNTVDTGEFWFIISIDGTQFAETMIYQPIFAQPDDPTYPYAFYYQNNAGGAALVTQINSNGNWRTHYINNVDVPSVVMSSPAEDMSTWTSGNANSTGEPVKAPMMFLTNTSGANRAFGSTDDIRIGGNLQPSQALETPDADTFRLVTIQSLWMMVEAADLNPTGDPLDL